MYRFDTPCGFRLHGAGPPRRPLLFPGHGPSTLAHTGLRRRLQPLLRLAQANWLEMARPRALCDSVWPPTTTSRSNTSRRGSRRRPTIAPAPAALPGPQAHRPQVSVHGHIGHGPARTAGQTVRVVKTATSTSPSSAERRLARRLRLPVVVSNDSDLAEGAWSAHLGKRVGVVTSQVLKNAADFVRQIRPQALRRSQLPDPIPGTNLGKPPSW